MGDVSFVWGPVYVANFPGSWELFYWEVEPVHVLCGDEVFGGS